MTSLTEAGETTAFSYDARDRLTGASGAYTTTYSYDALGNLLRKDGLDYAYDPVHPHAVQARTLNGVEQESYRYDANGNLITRNGASLTWDAENRLVSLTQDGRVTSFTYDAEGRRVKTTTPWGTTYAIGAHYELRVPAAGVSVLAGDVTGDCQVRLDDLQALAARWGQPWSVQYDINQDGSPIDAGDLQAAAANWRASLPAPCESVVVKSYRLGERLVALRQQGQLRYVLTDHLGSVRRLADEQGRPVAGSEQHFFPFGRVRAGQPVVVPTARNFTGQPLDATTGLLYYSAGAGYGRYYDPAVGRWTQPDSIVPNPGDPQQLNRYSYALNNPVRYTDPTGHDPACGPFCNPIVIDRLAQGAQQLWVQAQALCVQHCPTLIQAGQTYGEKIVHYAQRTLDTGSSGSFVDKGGNTGDPGGLDPKDPWQWGRNYRANYEQYYGVTRDPNYHVHHVLPQQWRDVLAKANINVDDPRWLREVARVDVHQQYYTNRWGEFARGLQGRTPTPQELVRFAQQLEQEYIQKFGMPFYRQGEGLPGRIDWDELWTLINAALQQGGTP